MRTAVPQWGKGDGKEQGERSKENKGEEKETGRGDRARSATTQATPAGVCRFATFYAILRERGNSLGSHYVNYTLRGVTQDAVAKALARRRSIVTPPVSDTVVVFDRLSDDQDQQVIASLAVTLSEKLRCPVLAVLNHDDDILWYQLCINGMLQDEYDSTPGYFDSLAELSAPVGGNAGKLCAAFGSPNVSEVDRILQTPSFADDGYTFAFERHHDLVTALGISTFGVGSSYENVEHGHLPDGLSSDVLVRTT